MTRIEQERRRRGWSQTMLAAWVGLHQPQVSLIERRRLQPNEEQAEQLARLFGVPADALLDEVEAPEPEAAEVAAR